MSFSRLRAPRNLYPPLPSRPDRLELYLVGEDLPQHLPRLDSPTDQEARDVADAGAEAAGDLLDLHGRESCHPTQLVQIGRKHSLPGLLGAQTRFDLISWERAVRQGIDQPIQPLLNLRQLSFDLCPPVEDSALALRQPRERFLDRGIEHGGVQGIADRPENRPVEQVLPESDAIDADPLPATP